MQRHIFSLNKTFSQQHKKWLRLKCSRMSLCYLQFSLSLGNTQIEFIVTPVKKEMAVSKVTISNAAWKSLHGKAIYRVNKLKESDIQDTWMYHPKTKMITVSKIYMGWEILLKTYTSRGHPMREHNVFFSELEWRELMKNLPAINARISEIELQRRQNTNKKTHMSMVQ